ncbi:TetR/AcrR family transcriptional regulator [Paenibacillus sp. FJAT-26967]|uniref:TetR/AcrR family transcriptional regulator n=1 Tax=Paenibacillus sp. FJAT-26967 TaxID=1729690 RepID=UPI000A4C1BDB|nr:TetR/AcrR family transcriptional regulator [Paenibacillus sp. FJAT-26967]
MAVRKERQDAVENRRLILQTAEVLFEKHGIDNVSMQEIAQTAGIGKGTLYRRYKDKGDLCSDLVQKRFLYFQKQVTAYLADTDNCSPIVQLQKVLREYVNMVEELSSWLKVIQTYDSLKGRSATYFCSEPYVFMYETIYSLLTEMEKQKLIKLIDLSYTTDVFLSALSPDFYLYQRQEKGYLQDDILEKFYSLLLKPLIKE